MPKIKDRIKSPSDLKKLTPSEVTQLAAEIREELVNTVTATGGHLASNLGVVELTLALHRVFDSPKDKIIWDVGHQSYTHKLVTGRWSTFSSLRQYKGLSGFPDRKESVHDPFGTGHASTSISAALGMAIARDISKESYSVVAIIGDGALTGGMAFEALNHIGSRGTNLIVILNDNGMSISPTVGALAKWISKVWLHQKYLQAEEKAKEVLAGFSWGRRLWQVGKRLKSSFKGLILPARIWEELGFTYLGPFDGHNIMELEQALTFTRDHINKPAFLHVITTKGKGYSPAEKDPLAFHSLSPKESGAKLVPTYSEVFARTVLKLAKDNPRIVVITAAMSDGNCLDIVAREFPERVFDVGICEEHAVTLAAGLAVQGFVPIVAIYATFLQRAFDQIIHDICLQELPVIFAIDRAGIVGEDGKTHQGIFDLSYLTLIPNLVVAAPKDENELQHLLYTAILAKRPMAIRYPRSPGLDTELDSALHAIPIGKGEIIREGKDLAILAIGSTLAPASEASEKLTELGIETMVINPRFAKPLDSELIARVAKEVGRIVTVEENVLHGGFGSSVLEFLQRERVNEVKIRCLGIPDEFVEHGARNLLLTKYDLDSEGIVRQVLNFFPELLLQKDYGVRV